MVAHAVDTVKTEDKRRMKEILRGMDEVSVDEIVNRDDTPFDNKQEVVSVLHALLNEGEVSHNVSREYYLTA
ncbi:hypothetical protein KM295_14130 [Natronomonas sp. F2-12]|jgi:hypothetical protein|uniref:Uncharacterized protein n=1 Tax=Natronomonas aquatica TaxID=2841590 RepID=A0A9R1CVM5_9EURY|nr:hypothetical protein [Natronomonas aquatica]MCQ4334593.1 hypothetical protein [Natronomonas aquatica]